MGCQEAALARLSAHMQEELVGPEERQQLLEAELAGKRWAALAVLDPRPCCQSGDAWYFRVGFTFEHSQLQFAAKVRRVKALGGAEGAGSCRSGSVGFSTEHGISPFCTHFCICWVRQRCWRGLGDEGDSSHGAKGHVKNGPAGGQVRVTQPEGPAHAKKRLERSWPPGRAG